MGMDPGKLFIGGISWDTNEDRLREYFQTFGEVLEAEIMKDRTTGRARGFGFVVFADPLVAERVVKEKHVIDGRVVEAKKAVPRDDQHFPNRNKGSIQDSPSPVRTKKIFVGGLPSSITESDFKKYFDQFGTITDAVVMYDHNTQRPRGFGFITYDSEEAVDKVLLNTFHELNGKMVEVKRAVPKELSPGPPRSQLLGLNYSPNRVNNFLNAYTQGYDPNLMGGYLPRMDSRYSGVSRGGYPFNPSIGPSVDSRLSSNYIGSSSFSSNVGYGRGLNPIYSMNSNRFTGSAEFGGIGGGSRSMLGSVNQNVWGDGGPNYTTNSGSSSAFLRSGGGSTGAVGGLGSTGTIWGSSISSQGMGVGSLGGGNVGYSGDSFQGGEGYGRRIGNGVATSSYAVKSEVNDGSFGNLYGSDSLYGNPNWQSSSSLLSSSSYFGLGNENPSSDVIPNSTIGYVGGGVINRSNRDFGDR